MKNKSLKKILAGLVLASIICATFVACGNAGKKNVEDKSNGLSGIYEKTDKQGSLIRKADENLNRFIIEFTNASAFKFTVNEESTTGIYSQNDEGKIDFKLPNGFGFQGTMLGDTLVVAISGSVQFGGVTDLMGYIRLARK